nr:integrase, catalytic region, zinc finger, CCHC-type, peptidase aspartic, catalytic [Tanacetum cinerariifolium]
MYNVSHQQHYSQSSSTPPSTYVPPHLADNTHRDSGISPTDNLIKNLTNTLALLTQSYKTFLPQTNNQLRTSSNTRNQATVQDGRVVVQNVQGRQNRGQGTNPWGGGTAGFGGVQNRVGNANPCQARQDLALSVDNVFQVDDCDTSDSDVDEALTAQTMFIDNLSSADPVNDEAGPSFDSNILSEVHDHDRYQDTICAHHEEHAMHDNVQLNHVVDSHASYTSAINMISYDQYVKDNAMPVVHMRNTEDTLEIAEINRRKMDDKMKDPECVTHKIKIAPHDYSKENFLATFTPQNQLTLEQIFWSHDLIKMKFEALKEQTTVSRPIKALTVYPPNTPATLVPRVLPTKKEAKVVRPLDSLIVSACRYTKHSQELLEYAIGTCPQDSHQRGCSKHMTRDRSWLMNFMKKFIEIVRFGNDHFGAIMGYGDYVIGDSVISRVYYVEGLGHNLFSVRQFCDVDLEVAFRKHSCYVRDTDGVELIKGSRGSNLYTISVKDMIKS